MNKNVIRSFLCELKNQSFKKHFFFKINYNKINSFVVSFLTKEGYLRGFFFINEEKKKKIKKMCVLLKYNEIDKPSFIFIKNKNVLMNRLQFKKQKDLRKFCNGLGLALVYSIKRFISNERAFWLKIGGKNIVEIK